MDGNQNTAADTAVKEVKPAEKKINAMALISYFGVLALVPYLAGEKDEFARFHAKQGLVLFIGEIGSWMLLMVPFLGFLVVNILSLVWFVLSVLGIINVVNNKKEKLPVIGDLADRIKL